MKINLTEDDIITISFCLGYTMGKLPVDEKKFKETMNKLTTQLIKQTKKEVEKELR